FTDPQRSRVGLGALLVGYYSDDGHRLLYAGKVGTGYTQEMLRDLRQRLDVLQQRRSPFDEASPRGDTVHWVKPELVAEIAFGEWTQNGLLRQPRFEGLRPDKKPSECHRERPKTAGATQTTLQIPDRQPSRPERGDTNMVLKEYRAKRNFRKTPEPAATLAK